MRQKQSIFSLFLLSPSSRRAWIEISKYTALLWDNTVALLAEGVDRNISWIEDAMIYERSPSSQRVRIEIRTSQGRTPAASRRPPRGGRG